MRSKSWLLIETLDRHRPTVIASGKTVKNRVPLGSYIHGSDRPAILHAVRRACISKQICVETTSVYRQVIVDPILDAECGTVSGAWIFSGSQDRCAIPDRSVAWAFTWDFDSDTASRSAATGGDGEQMGQPASKHSVAETLSSLDFGMDIATVISKAIEAKPGSWYQTTALHKGTGAPDRLLSFIVRFETAAGGSRSRVLRGLTHDLGIVKTSEVDTTQRPLSALIVEAMTDPRQYRAIIDLESLQTLYWYGDAPETIAWRYRDRIQSLRIHPADQPIAAAAARALRSYATGSTSRRCALRFLSKSGDFVAFDVHAMAIDLSTTTRAGLISLIEQPS